MNIVFCIIIFILGTWIGSFYATAIKRIGKDQKVLSIHSYCTNCGKKLNFLEKIPILSYIFLKGKCSHCKEKIKFPYFLLEIISGILFLLSANGLNLNVASINITKLISFIFIIFYFSYIILTVGMDKTNRRTSSSLLAFGIIISLIYIVYLCIVEKSTVYKNIAHLIIMTLLLLFNIINTKKRAQSSYVLDLLTTLLIMLIFTGEITCIISIIGTLISIAIYILINRMKVRNKKVSFSSKVKIGYIMGILNIFVFTILINIVK